MKLPLATKLYEFDVSNGPAIPPSRLAKTKVESVPVTTTLNIDTQNTHRRSIDNLLRFLDITGATMGTQQTLDDQPKHSGPNVVDINQAIEMPPAVLEKRQNKNDFYRYLLMQNTSNPVQTLDQ